MKRLSVLFLAFFSLVCFVTPSQVSAQLFSGAKTDACKGLNLSDSSRINEECDEDAQNDTNDLLTSILNLISIVVGIAAVIMIIIGGFRYITSGGDSGSITGARNTVIYALVGLVLVALAQIIVRFVLNRIS